MTSTKHMSEAERLEQLWAGQFGDDYVERNLASYDRRGAFWLPLIEELAPRSVVEIGANVGGNIQWIVQRVAPRDVVGVDVNAKALRLLGERVPEVRAMHAPARDLPLADRSVELVFTMGVLIHQPEESLERVMSEMVRVSSRYVLCGEYYDDGTVEVPYRGHEGALFRRDYGGLFEELFPFELTRVREGYLDEEHGFDRTTWWLFERG